VASALPSLGAIGTFQLTDQFGRAFAPEQLQSGPWLAAFIFTRCPTVCPRITALMKQIQAGAQTRSLKLHLVSFSVDPEFDTPEVLRAYAAAQGIAGDWSLITGDSSTIVQTAEERFKIGVSGTPTPGAEHLGMSHGSHLVLIDKAGQIRGYFQSSEASSVAAVLGAVERLQ
jgi:protein SCO1